VGLIVVVLVAAIVFAVRVARAEQSALPQTVTGSTPAGVVGRTVPPAFATTAASGGVGTATGRVTAGGVPPTATILVHVVGQVARPGVVTLTGGARVADAITLAGGASPGADLQHINLARSVVDGEQIYVPRPGESVPAPPGQGSGAAPGALGGASRGGSGGSAAGSGAGSGGAPLNLNAADAAALDDLPGIGPVLAQRIVDWRTEHGRFTSVDELGEVSGIGEKLLSQIRPKVTV
jgi:competence protein ComEA